MSASFSNATVPGVQQVAYSDTISPNGIVSYLYAGVWNWQFLLTLVFLLTVYDQGEISQYCYSKFSMPN
jgi:hypothetical protein